MKTTFIRSPVVPRCLKNASRRARFLSTVRYAARYTIPKTIFPLFLEVLTGILYFAAILLAPVVLLSLL